MILAKTISQRIERENMVSVSNIGPQTEFSQLLHATKYRAPGESFDDYCVRYARTLTDNSRDFYRLLHYIRNQTILPAGRQQHSIGQPYQTTAYNCFVGAEIPDSYEGIMEALKLGGMTLRTGGGVGWDFSTLRPAGEPIRGLGPGSFSSGPIPFMGIWDKNCETILTAGHRRGAMMGVLRVDHPDIFSFVGAKRGTGALRNFNISVAVTNQFMEALDADGLYPLKFGGKEFSQVRAVDVWSRIMESNWDWAEPGVLFIDRINERNPLWYCERITATNPCAEQPLPTHGACLLGSINLVKFVSMGVFPYFDFDMLDEVVEIAIRAFDMVPENTIYPLPAQEKEAKAKRRMGLGVTGMANALEMMGLPYGTPQYLKMQDHILRSIAYRAYRASIKLASERGPFPLFDQALYMSGHFVQEVLPGDIKHDLRKYGIRNALLLSIAPTGTISMVADNVSSGIEPPYALKAQFDIEMPGGRTTFDVTDFAFVTQGIKGRTANEVSAEEHVDVLCRAQQWVDSSISKTCNVNGQVGGTGPGVSFENFKQIYKRAWDGGAKGCTTFNRNGKLMGVRHEVEDVLVGEACTFDAEGRRTCE